MTPLPASAPTTMNSRVVGYAFAFTCWPAVCPHSGGLFEPAHWHDWSCAVQVRVVGRLNVHANSRSSRPVSHSRPLIGSVPLSPRVALGAGRPWRAVFDSIMYGL